MIPDNVTLVVKAPNQQIEDQNIECQSSWTVRQLKGHLSRVYPSKPSADEQKIIYSGQLLDDSQILKDILRSYESQLTQFTHTMHLVCTPKRNAVEERRKPAPAVVTEAVVNGDGVRRRNVQATAANVEPAPRPEVRQNDQNHTVEMQNYLHSFVNYGRVPPYPANYNIGANLPMPTDAASMANHMLMMQQAYMQYMQQYANMWQAGGNVAPATQPRNVTNEVPQPPQAEAPEPAPAEDPEEARHDWLDTLYAASRLVVLVSLVYLYSSPLRLLLVLMLCAAGYLHQVGFFRDFAANDNPPAPPYAAPNANNAVNNAGNDANNAENDANNAENDANNAENNASPPPSGTPQPNDENQQSYLAVTWMVVSSFLTSLIPEMNQ